MTKKEWMIFLELKSKEIAIFLGCYILSIILFNFIFYLFLKTPIANPDYIFNFKIFNLFIDQYFIGFFICLTFALIFYIIGGIGYGIYCWIKNNIEKTKRIVGE